MCFSFLLFSSILILWIRLTTLQIYRTFAFFVKTVHCIKLLQRKSNFLKQPQKETCKSITAMKTRAGASISPCSCSFNIFISKHIVYSLKSVTRHIPFALLCPCCAFIFLQTRCFSLLFRNYRVQQLRLACNNDRPLGMLHLVSTAKRYT